ncbi:MAG: DUF3488 and transglutaminase-like domain-containing protein, partial [Actinomycetota bacterium]|nr:DUF3488 and transglutaminase-like domain-containing protein [Actinomycetota bacterium]
MSRRTRLTLAAAVATLLGSSALSGTFDSIGWLPYVAGAILAVTAGALLVRAVRLPAALEPVAAGGALVAYLTAVFGQGSGALRVLPTGRTFGVLHDQVRFGFADIQQLAAPVPPHRGLMLLTAAGVGLVALLVQTCADAAGRPALAGLPLLALVAVPAAVVKDGVGWLPFALGAVGYLGLLLADGRERLGAWGTLVGTDQPEPTPLLQSGRRIGATAVSLAVVLPALLPGLHGQAFGSNNGNGLSTGSGASAITTINPIASLKGQLVQPAAQTVLKVTTTDPSPGYLRVTALDQFDGRSWSQSPLHAPTTQRIADGLPVPQGLSAAVPAPQFRTTVRAGSLSVSWLPLYYPARKVSAHGDWRYDLRSRTVFSTHADTRDLTYSFTSAAPQPTRELLETATAYDPEVIPYTATPGTLSPRIRQLVASVTAGARTPYQKAVALQAYFHGPDFSYDLTVPRGTSDDDLVNFLEGKRGYCEQYAAAMAIMARVAGLPARVAIGFTRGTKTGTGSYTVTTHDAHAWPEIYFAGVGWLQFEPTPRGDGQAVAPAYSNPPPLPASATGGDDETGIPTVDPGGEPFSVGAHRSPLEPTEGAGSDSALAAGQLARAGPPWLPIGLVLLVLLAALAPAVTAWVTRRRRWVQARTPAEAATAAWADVFDRAADLGYRPEPSDTPRTAADRLVRQSGLAPVASAAVRLLATGVEQARYAAAMTVQGDLPGARDEVRRAL